MIHPLVGVWIVEVEDATRSRVTHSFRDDGTVLVTSAFHGAQGVWRATGERSAELVVMRPIEAADRAFVGWQSARGSVEVSEDGESYEMSGSISRPLLDGGIDESLVTLRGTRLRLTQPVSVLPLQAGEPRSRSQTISGSEQTAKARPALGRATPPVGG